MRGDIAIRSSPAAARTPVARTGPTKPVVIASANGLTMKNGGDLSCVETAFEAMMRGDDVLESLIAGVCMYAPTEESVYLVCTAQGARHERREPLLEGSSA